MPQGSRRPRPRRDRPGFESHLTTVLAGSLSPSRHGNPQEPRNGQRFQRYNDHCWWFVANLPATGVAAWFGEAVCAGGRDRFRTCGLCRVKTSPPAPSPRRCRLPQHDAAGRHPKFRLRAGATRSCARCRCWQLAGSASEPLTSCMPSMLGWFAAPRSTLRPHTFTEVRGGW